MGFRCAKAKLQYLGLGHWTPQFFEHKLTELSWPRTIAQFGLTPAAGLHWILLHGDDLAAEEPPFLAGVSSVFHGRVFPSRVDAAIRPRSYVE
jgi:hypothetical protein